MVSLRFIEFKSCSCIPFRQLRCRECASNERKMLQEADAKCEGEAVRALQADDPTAYVELCNKYSEHKIENPTKKGRKSKDAKDTGIAEFDFAEYTQW